MKQPIAIALLVALALAGCKKAETLSFCEGMSPEGKTVNCGTEFSQGDLSAVITSKEPFGVSTLRVTVLEKKKFKDEAVKSFDVEVKADESMRAFDLSFYNDGEYRVTVSGKENSVIGENEIRIIDTY